MASIRTELKIEAPVEDVWHVLSDLPTWSDWNPLMVEMVGETRAGADLALAVRTTSGRRFETVATILVFEPQSELRWGGGRRPWIWIEHFVRVRPDGTGTLLEHGEDFGGPVGWLLKTLFIRDAPYHSMNQAVADRVAALAAHVSDREGTSEDPQNGVGAPSSNVSMNP